VTYPDLVASPSLAVPGSSTGEWTGLNEPVLEELVHEAMSHGLQIARVEKMVLTTRMVESMNLSDDQKAEATTCVITQSIDCLGNRRSSWSSLVPKTFLIPSVKLSPSTFGLFATTLTCQTSRKARQGRRSSWILYALGRVASFT
jgi:hypothetical protein